MTDGSDVTPESVVARPASTGEADKATTSRTEKARKAAKAPAAPKFDLEAPELYLNRELTWLAFNRRVLHGAEDERNPLLERVKFLSIASSTLDEFVMKRIGGLKQQVVAGIHTKTVDGRTPRRQLFDCYEVLR